VFRERINAFSSNSEDDDEIEFLNLEDDSESWDLNGGNERPEKEESKFNISRT
jgi:hypothetical protein